MQHALNRTWARWQQETGGTGPLELPHYEAIGTMAHALNEHAEEAYAQLGSERKQQICEKMFKALTDKGTDARGIRRPTKLGTLCAVAEATDAEVIEVLAVFRAPTRSFVMPPAGEPLTAETVIDISHESLMRVWDRLKGWGDAEALSAQMYRRLAETAALHAVGRASLWRDRDLEGDSVAFSRDGTVVASGICVEPDASKRCRQGGIRLWNPVSRKELRTVWTGYPGPPLSLAFRSDARALVSSSCANADGGVCTGIEVQIWSIATGQFERRSINDHCPAPRGTRCAGQVVCTDMRRT